MTRNEILDAGFVFHRVKYCCGGTKNEIYILRQYELRIRPKHKIFQIRHCGNGITPFLTIDKLKNKLIELEILIPQTQKES